MYDYIIVGAGSAGCVLANRLSADHKVLLLEAGKPDKFRDIHIPAVFPTLFQGPYDWQYYTEPQQSVNNRKLFWPRGKTLGGCSSINAMIYIRGHRKDYDYWESLGNEGWGYESVLPFFKKSQHQERGADQYHGVDGPLNVTNRHSSNILSHKFIEAGVECGIAHNEDFNGATQQGVGLYQATIKNGQRHSTATAFLKPILHRKNLTIHTDALATRLIFENQSCTGIEYLHQGKLTQAQANKETILCGGAINSPQLLMLSGIGPQEHLQEMGISVIADLPVGQNLQDHLVVPVCYESIRPVSLDGAKKLRYLLYYLITHKGPLSSNVAEAGGFIKINSNAETPDLQFHFAPGSFINHGLTEVDQDGFTIAPTLVCPKSVGYIKLRSQNPQDHPIIEPQYLSQKSDLDILIEGIKWARKLAKAKAFEKFRGAEIYPGTQVQTDEEIAAYIRDLVQTLYHPVGTCKMGNDSSSVVDAKLKVHGVQKLRVADASIMPRIVNGNTNAPTIMIAEKAAHMICSPEMALSTNSSYTA